MTSDLPLALNAALFAAAACVVWQAGTRLARYADIVARRTGMDRAFLGLLLLGGITSLPELAVAVSASLQGTPVLSVNDVLGSAAINLVILAIADVVIGRGTALTSAIGSPAVMLQGVLGVAVLALLVAPNIVGDRLVLGMGAWSWAIVAAYAGGLWLLAQSHAESAWKPARAVVRGSRADHERHPPPVPRIGIAIAAAAIAGAGFMLAKTGDALAAQTGLGESFFGAVFLAAATSLPEASTVIATVRMRQYEMAIGDVFGTNLFNVTIIALVDWLHDGDPVLLEAGAFAAFGALLALVLTAVFLLGMLERGDRVVLRMGIDSAAVMVLYAAGVALLFGLR